MTSFSTPRRNSEQAMLNGIACPSQPQDYCTYPSCQCGYTQGPDALSGWLPYVVTIAAGLIIAIMLYWMRVRVGS